MKSFLFLICFLISKGLCCQEPDPKKLLAIIHLQTDDEAKQKINAAFPYMKKLNQKEQGFFINQDVWYISLQVFNETIVKHPHGFDSSGLFGRSFDSIHYFFPYLDTLHSKIIDRKSKRLFLTFSKPIDNILIAELLDSTFIQSPNFRLGYCLRILFVYNDKGMIEKAFYNSAYFN